MVVFAPVAPAACEVRETSVPWSDREGAALELQWRTAGGATRAVVALADGASSAEASIARTDAAGVTQLANLGVESLTWTVDGRPVTVAPGGTATVRRGSSVTP